LKIDFFGRVWVNLRVGSSENGDFWGYFDVLAGVMWLKIDFLVVVGR
jgi:hypothetical protein